MSHELDISFLDDTEITKKIFPMAYSITLADSTQSASLNTDPYFIEVDDQVRICCRFYIDDKDYPSILYFHDNNETVLEQNTLASRLQEKGINLFATDYRGYALSDGMPSMTSLFHDCHKIYDEFKKIIKENNYNPTVFVMGRSLGSIPAMELAYHYKRGFKGLIIESGSAKNLSALWNDNVDASDIQKLEEAKFYNKDKITEITIPTLVIHGDLDNLIPVQIGQALYKISGAKAKELVIIEGAGHNDLIDKGANQYFSAIEKFVKKKPRARRTKK